MGKSPYSRRDEACFQFVLGDKMPSLFDIKTENETPSLIKKYVTDLSNQTNRNTIIYYSGWLSSSNYQFDGIDDMDKNGFIAMCEGLDFKKGLDLILHTPGGSIAATESTIDYLNNIFNGNIRAIVPQLAMSGGTMIACSCREIIMGKQSNLGPVDPQLNGFPAQGVTSEFEKIMDDIEKNPSRIAVWKPILSKIEPSFLDSCYKSIEWANDILESSLKNNMFKDNPNDEKITSIIKTVGSSKYTKHHSRHLSAGKCKDLGLNVTLMDENELEMDLIMSIHHACMIMFNQTNAIKLFANQDGKFLDFRNM